MTTPSEERARDRAARYIWEAFSALSDVQEMVHRSPERAAEELNGVKRHLNHVFDELAGIGALAEDNDLSPRVRDHELTRGDLVRRGAMLWPDRFTYQLGEAIPADDEERTG